MEATLCSTCTDVFEVMNDAAQAVGDATLPGSALDELCEDCGDSVRELLEDRGD